MGSRKVIAALLVLSFSSFSFAEEHTGEIIYKIKDEYRKPGDKELIKVFTPDNNVISTESYLSLMNDSGYYDYVGFNTIENEPEEFEDVSELFNVNLDPDFQKQWQHTKLETIFAWDYTKGAHEVIVGVCDSGVESTHEDLLGNVLSSGWDFVDEDNDAEPVTQHGTFVSGLIAANSMNQLGGAGVSPNVKILPLKITTSRGSTTMKKIADCIQYAADHGAKVINVSFTGVQNEVVEIAGKYAADKGALLVYAAGNQGRDRADYPDFENVFIVGATNSDDQRWTYRKFFKSGGSNYGPFIDVVAPGHKVYSTTTYIRHNNQNDEIIKYKSGSGTSYATPITAAVAALIYSINPNFTPFEVANIITQSAENIGDEYMFGAGRINAHEAVKLATKYFNQQ